MRPESFFFYEIMCDQLCWMSPRFFDPDFTCHESIPALTLMSHILFYLQYTVVSPNFFLFIKLFKHQALFGKKKKGLCLFELLALTAPYNLKIHDVSNAFIDPSSKRLIRDHLMHY